MEKSKLLDSVDSAKKLDQEWVLLILEAKSLGMKPKEIMDFFKHFKELNPENQ